MAKILILGGTGWLGHALAEQFVAHDDDVTCLARGTSGGVPPGATLIRADRASPDAYDQVKNVIWDRVIELSYDADLVISALNALGTHAEHWTLISSVSVYAAHDEPGADETAALVHPDDLENYAHAKVFAEQVTQNILRNHRHLIVRPGLIAGPGDPSDRFSYWVSRLALAQDKDVLSPTAEDLSVQYIDVRDLAQWIVVAGVTEGIVNAVGTPRPFKVVLDAAARVTGFTGTLVPVSDEWLLSQDLNYWAGPRSLPLWLPRDDAGFAQRSRARFAAVSNIERTLEQTLTDVLADERQRGLNRVRRSGLSRDEEEQLLIAWRSR